MKVDVRTYNPEVRAHVVEAVKRIITAESDASNLPQRPEIVQTDDIPVIINDGDVVDKISKVFKGHVKDSVQEMSRDTASDDFSIFTEAFRGIPCAYWNFGGTDPSMWDRVNEEGNLSQLPANHSAYFAPVIEPIIRTGTDAMGLAALSFLTRIET